MEPLSYWIDRGAELCGSQNKLAARLGATSSTLSEMRTGKRGMPRDMLIALGQLCDFDGAKLFEDQRARRRRQSIEKQARAMGLLSVLMVAVACVTMAALPSPANATQAIDSISFFPADRKKNDRHISAAAVVARAVRGLSSMAERMAQSILKAMRGQMLHRMISPC